MYNIAIDGPSGAGKSTISKRVAESLGITYLDTGAMYRAVAVYVSRQGVDVNDAKAVETLLPDIRISYRGSGENKQILLNDEDVSTAIREHAVSKMASDVSKQQKVRDFLIAMQRKIASESDVILDGRDITSNVLPNAQFKFYLTASVEERARRRYAELQQKGSSLSYEQILTDIRDRDYNDMHRPIAPLVVTPDADVIDSTRMEIDQVVAYIVEKVRKGLASQSDPQDKANASVGHSDKESHAVVSVKNAQTEKKAHWFYRFVGKVGRWVLRFLWPTHILFPQNFVHDRKAIIICNHYGLADANPILSRLFGKKSNVVFKSELARFHVVAEVLKQVGGIPVRRGESDITAVKKVLGALNREEQVLIFPEGSRNPRNIKEMLPFKDGAAMFALKAKCEIVPIMHYRRPRPFRKNYMIVGKPFDLSDYYTQKLAEAKQPATDYIERKMLELRRMLDCIVEQFHGNLKKFLSAHPESAPLLGV